MPDTQELVARLTRYADAYHGGGEPLVSDAEYDALEDMLRKRDPGNAFFKRVGAAPVGTKTRHRAPMGSLDKVNTPAELLKWLAPLQARKGLIITEKLDGLSLSVRLVGGRPTQAVTRGDGEVGDDITANALQMAGLRGLTLPGFTGYLRGEIICRRSVHAEHFPNGKNPRNSASGTSKRLTDPDGKIRLLDVLFYQVLPDSGPLPTKLDELQLLARHKFQTPQWWVVEAGADYGAEIDRIYRHYTDTLRAKLDYDIDGLVPEVNDNQEALDLGVADSRPHGARAYKFPYDQKATVLRAIVWQVGPTGRVTPVALFDPVVLAGATVERATLHNVARVLKLQLCLGSNILVARMGDVIPGVIKNLDTGATADEEEDDEEEGELRAAA